MPTRNVLYGSNAMAEHRRHAAERKRFRRGLFGSPLWERHEVIPASLAAVRRAGSRHAKAGLTDAIPDLSQAGCDSPPRRPVVQRSADG